VVGSIGGPATYAWELVTALVAKHPETEFTVFTDRPGAFDSITETVLVPLESAWRQPLWDHWGVAKELRRRRLDLYHGTKGVLPRFVRTPGVVTIHDLAVRVMPETFSFAQRMHLRLETASTISRAACVLTVSKNSARDLTRFYPKAAGKIEVVPNASSAAIKPADEKEIAAFKEKYDIDAPAVGYLGTVQPRKNVDVLADAFARAAGDEPWHLLVAGRMRPGYRPRCFDGGDSRIRYLGEIPDSEIPAFLGALACMVSPSAYEGFGLTFIEAMAAGCPVVGVANSSVPEVVGDAGLLVPRVDAVLLAEAIESVVTDFGLTASLAKRGVARAALFSWAETARRTHEIYRRVCSEQRGEAR
jgi:glycosyltransferase involved in cell wall biosynthesis